MPQARRTRDAVLGRGAFHWTKHERYSQRWGAFYLDDPAVTDTEDGYAPAERRASTTPVFDPTVLQALVGRRVRLRAEIVDLAPLPPVRLRTYNDFVGAQVGDVVELGVGILRIEAAARDLELPGDQVLALQTGRRATHWMCCDAFIYLRGHTVELHAEPTADPFAPSLTTLREDWNDQVVTVIRAGRRQRRPVGGSLAVQRRAEAARRRDRELHQ